MSATDLVQTVSLVAVAITLGLSARQNRHTAVQGREAASQSSLARASLSHATHQAIISHGAGVLAAMLDRRPRLLAWFLQTRRIPVADDDTNSMYLLLFLRMDEHESRYLAYLADSLPEDVWLSWRRVIEIDAATPEFRILWKVVMDCYCQRFVSFMNESILASS